MSSRPVLVTGATGYVGGRLVPHLLAQGQRVRALARSLGKLAARPWAGHPLLDLALADVRDQEAMSRALEGCEAAFYLVHSMNPAEKDYAQADRQAAQTMAHAAAVAGVERIIYLGGLIPHQQAPSRHLASRAEVGDILGAGPVPLTWLKAAMILGSGSASFEIMRYLVEHLPVMITPSWVRSECQPIAIRNVIGYLAGCLEHPETAGQTYDICGPDRLTYEEIFQIYAQEAGLAPRRIIPLPFFSPAISAYWIHLVTPVPASLARPLAQGLKNTVVCADRRIRRVIPQELLSCRVAIRKALEKEMRQVVETCWSDAGPLTPPEWVQRGDPGYAGGAVFAGAHGLDLPLDPAVAWRAVTALGPGEHWAAGGRLWRWRCGLDRLLGGVGASRKGRAGGGLALGDAVGPWRVADLRPQRRLLLASELKEPGDLFLDLRLWETGPAACRLQVMGRFVPRGLGGVVYGRLMAHSLGWLTRSCLVRLAGALGHPQTEPSPLDPRAAAEVCLPGERQDPAG